MSENEDTRDESARRAGASSDLNPRHEEALARFIEFWGDMASNWGINRTMAQIHALLYAVERPLDTDEIMERLQISRGNANMNLRSLVDWNLVKKVHQHGSRNGVELPALVTGHYPRRHARRTHQKDETAGVVLAESAAGLEQKLVH